MQDLHAFFGCWALDPARCAYGETPVPKAGAYTILPDGEHLWFHIRWRGPSDVVRQGDFHASFAEPVTLDPEHPDIVLAARIDDDRLVTELRREQDVLQLAERWLEDETLWVRQVAMTDEGLSETLAAYHRADVKQVMVYRRDLKMRKGKIAAQCAHASMAVFFRHDAGPMNRLEVPLDGPMTVWSKGRFAKVVLSVDGEDDLARIAELAEARGLPFAMITDSGKTEFKGQPTRTTVAIGPALDVEIDEITGPSGLVTTKLA